MSRLRERSMIEQSMGKQSSILFAVRRLWSAVSPAWDCFTADGGSQSQGWGAWSCYAPDNYESRTFSLCKRMSDLALFPTYGDRDRNDVHRSILVQNLKLEDISSFQSLGVPFAEHVFDAWRLSAGNGLPFLRI